MAPAPRPSREKKTQNPARAPKSRDTGDLALVNAMRMATGVAHTKEDLLQMSASWQPYRSMATMLFWHYYIKEKNIRILH